MSIAHRTVQTTWTGSLPEGSGELGSSSSTALDGLRVTWGSRTARPDGKTSPEELLGIYRDALRTYGLWSYRSAPLVER